MTPKIALVLGDPGGIGAELAARLLAEREIALRARILVIGDRRLLALGERIAGVGLGLRVVGEVEAALAANDDTPTMLDRENLDPALSPLGQATAAGGRSVLDNLATALRLAKDGRIDAITFVPFNKAALKLGGNPHDDEIGFMADMLGVTGGYGEFNVLDGMWNARVTSHVPLRAVADLITRERVLERLQLTDRTMRECGVASPRIAVAALNPHAGDGGNFGTEDDAILAPAVADAQALGIDVQGPFPSDTVFLKLRDGLFDAVQTMYHDQGQIALKLMGFERGVTLLGGLPIPITTPAHGTAYDIAGTGKASPAATRNAFLLACSMAETRAAGPG
jgi:4-hydroxythreonine-4-phosphate dehydrogenase